MAAMAGQVEVSPNEKHSIKDKRKSKSLSSDTPKPTCLNNSLDLLELTQQNASIAGLGLGLVEVSAKERSVKGKRKSKSDETSNVMAGQVEVSPKEKRSIKGKRKSKSLSSDTPKPTCSNDNRSQLELTQQNASIAGLGLGLVEVPAKERAVKGKRKSKHDETSNDAPKPKRKYVKKAPTEKQQKKEAKAVKQQKKGAHPRSGRYTYCLPREKLPELVLRARELVQSWNTPKSPSRRADKELKTFISSCRDSIVNHSKCEAGPFKQTSVTYILMELRKSLIRHDWPGVKKLLKIFYRSGNTNDKLGWKACVTTLMYYPGGEAALRDFIEENKGNFMARDIMCGLLNIDGMHQFSTAKTSGEQEIGGDLEGGSE